MLNIMGKIDLKDRKILYQLDLNSRATLEEIGNKVDLSKNVVAYRINRLLKMGVIRNFFTIINPFKIGYFSIGFYLVYQYATSDLKNEIIKYFVKDKNTWFVASLDGRFDLGVSLWVKDLKDFYLRWENVLKKYRSYIADHMFINYVQAHAYPHSYLLDECRDADRKELMFTGGGEQVKINDLDIQVLRVLSSNARMPTIEIANKLNISAGVIKHRIKKLEKLGVIQGYRLAMDISKLGFKDFRIDFDFKDYNQRKQIVRYIIRNPHLTDIFTSIGHADLQLHVRVKNIDTVHKIMNDLNIAFPDIVRNYGYIHISKIYKQNYMPFE